MIKNKIKEINILSLKTSLQLFKKIFRIIKGVKIKKKIETNVNEKEL